MTVFAYHADVLARFPQTVGGVIVAYDLNNGPTPESLQSAYATEQAAARERLGEGSLSEIPAIAAWRSTYRQFGTEPTKYRVASESLLRRLQKKGDIPTINMLVDIGNLVSIRYALPLAFFDVRAVQGTITVHFADGTERYRELGSETIIHPDSGEVVFTDETGLVMARRWCWRQSAESAAGPETTDAIITLEAQHEGGRADVEAGVNDLLVLLRTYAGGTYTTAILDAATPSI